MPKNRNNKTKRKPRMMSKTSPPINQLKLLRSMTRGSIFPGQKVVRLNLPGNPVTLSTTVTTGVINESYSMSPEAQITGWSSRFQNTFQGYRLLSVRFRIRPLTTATGVTRFWFTPPDSDINADVTANVAIEYSGARTVDNTQNNSKSNFDLSYITRTIEELQYTQAGSTLAKIAYLNVYTDLATWGAPATATPLWLIQPIFNVEFMGLATTT